jgi:hypothetical protein
MKFAGYAKNNLVDELMTSEQLDQKRRHAVLEFKERMNKAIVQANMEILGKVSLNCDTFLKLARTASEMRAAYIKKGISLAGQSNPTREQIEELARMRAAFEETRDAFDALERLIERGYVNVPGC